MYGCGELEVQIEGKETAGSCERRRQWQARLLGVTGVIPNPDSIRGLNALARYREPE